MNLELAEFLESIPAGYIVSSQDSESIAYTYGDDNKKEIYASWWSSGRIFCIIYRKDGLRHRPSSEGPAYQDWHPNGQLYEVSYYEHGKLHRNKAEGPAVQMWNSSGEIVTQQFWENGVQINFLPASPHSRP